MDRHFTRPEDGRTPEGRPYKWEHPVNELDLLVMEHLDPALVRRTSVERGLLTEEEAAQLDDDAALSYIFQPNVSTARGRRLILVNKREYPCRLLSS